MMSSLVRRGGERHATFACPLFALSLLPLMLAASALAAPVLPVGGKVVAGSASIGRPSARSLTVMQSSSRAIIDWSGFSIGRGGAVVFDNGSGGATLNRVTGRGVSSLDGLLSGTGSVYVINPNGVIVGRSGVVRTGGSFVASALDTSDAGFLAGGPLSLAGSSNAVVINYGRIGSLGGDVALVAARVDNAGSLAARNGDAGLLAGYAVTLSDAGLDQGRFSVSLGGAGTSATNSGLIRAADAELRAEGGSIYALAGDTAGVIRATGVRSGGGRVWLVAEGGTTQVAGRIEAQGAQGSAGSVETSGRVVSLGSASLGSVSLDAHGGTWTVDPSDLTIDATAAASIDGALGKGTNVTEETTANGVVTSANGAIPAAAAQGNGDIFVEAPLAWTTGATLTLSAYRNLEIGAAISLTRGTLDLIAGTGNTGAVGPVTGAIGVNAPIAVTAAGKVNLTAAYDTQTISGLSLLELSFALGDAIDYGSSAQGGTLSVNGAPYTLVYSMAQLAALNGSTGDYALATGLSAPANPYGAAVVASFGGTLEGLGHTVSNLTIDDTTPADNVGLFGTLSTNGVVRDLGLVGGSITASGDGSNAGGLVGYSKGNSGAILANVYSTAAVEEVQDGLSGNYVGGIAGLYGGSIFDSFISAAVTGASNANAGGMVGDLIGGNIINAFSMGPVASYGEAGATAAGLAVNGGGTIRNVYAVGEVIGSRKGGAAGVAAGGGAFYDDYSDSQTSGQRFAYPGGIPNGGTSLTTRQLQGSLPAGFSSAVWGQVTGRSFPYLLNFYPTGTTPQVLAGHAYATLGGAALAGDTVEAVLNGSSVLGTVSTGHNGYWYMLLPQGALPAGATVTAFLDGATLNGAPLHADVVAEDITDPRGAIELELDGDALKVLTRHSTDTLSKAEAALAAGLGTATTAAGADILFSDPNGALVLAPGASLTLQGTIAGFSFDEGLDLGTGQLRLASTGAFGQSAGALVAATLLGGSRGTTALDDTSNQIAALGAWSGGSSLQLVSSQALTVTGPVTAAGDIALTATSGDIALDATLTAPVLSLDAQAGALSEDTTAGAIVVGTLNATAANGIVLTSPANQIGTLGTNSPGTGPDQITQ